MTTKKINYLFSLLGLLFLFSAKSAIPAASQSDTLPPEQNLKLVRIYFEEVQEINHLVSEYDIWEVNHDLGFLLAYLSPIEIIELGDAGFTLEIDQPRSTQIQQSQEFDPAQVSGIPGFPCYRTVEETYSSLAQLADSNPDLANWIDIGDSWEKIISAGSSGYDLQTLVLTNKNIPGPKPVIYLISAIHAREFSTAELATRFAEYLVDNYDQDPEATWLLDYFEIHITPQANPDGRKIAENGVFWRKNTDNDDGCENSSLWGTDLNRNSSFKWGTIGASTEACDETYSGPAASSEPETQALQNYLSSIFPDQRGPEDGDPAASDSTGLFISLHSYGRQVLFPWGWSALPSPNDQALETLGRKFGYFTGYQVCQSGEEGCIYQTSGSTDDWAYGDLGIASFTFEVGTTFFESCTDFEQQVFPDNFPGLLYAIKAARKPYQNPSGPDSIHLGLSAQKVAPGAGLSLHATADDTRYDSGGKGDEPIQSISAARFSIDKPSWTTGTQIYPLSPADGAFDNPQEALVGIVDTNFLTGGRHMIFVESQDADGNWGVPSTIYFSIGEEEFSPGVFPQQIAAYGSANSVISHYLNIYNLGTQNDSFDIQVSDNSWVTILSADTIGVLRPGESQIFRVDITIPGVVNVGDEDTAVITITSQHDPTKFARSTVKTITRNPEIYLPTLTK